MERNYWPHNNNLRYDPKVRALDKEFGGRMGYQMWSMLLEQFYDNGKRTLKFDEEYLFEACAEEQCVEPETFERFLDSCARLDLIDPLLWRECRQVSNLHAVEHMEHTKSVIESKSKAGRASGEARRRKSESNIA